MDDAELDQALKWGIHQTIMDATGHPIDRASLPVGRVPAGKTLVDFWHLKFPMGVMNFDDPRVWSLLDDMMSVRRLDAGALQALLDRIRRQLVEAFGPQQGGMMAAALISRAQQALTKPEDFPALLSDAELTEAYRVSMGLRNDFGYGVAVVNAGSKGAGYAKKAKEAAWPPTWLRSLASRADTAVESGAPVVGWTIWWASFMFGIGVKYFNSRADDYRAELYRRNLPIP